MNTPLDAQETLQAIRQERQERRRRRTWGKSKLIR